MEPVRWGLLPRPVQRVTGEHLRDRWYSRWIGPQCRKCKCRVALFGNGTSWLVQFWREIQSVDGVRFRVNRRSRPGNIILDESDTPRDGPLDDICGCDGRAIGELKGDCRAGPNTDLDEGVEPGQSVNQRGNRRGCHVGMFMPGHCLRVSMLVDVVPIGDVPAQVKREASGALRSVYNTDVTLHETQTIPSGSYDSSRDQYRAEDFIELASRVGEADKNIAITVKDLFYRRRNYVFGLAYLDGNASVVSTYRLQTSSDGGFSNKSANEIFADRVRKEVIHEMGHTFGLEHCDNHRCVMNFSPTVREVDRKEENLCGSCHRSLDDD